MLLTIIRAIQLRDGTPAQQLAAPSVDVKPDGAIQVVLTGSASTGTLLSPGGASVDLSLYFSCLVKATSVVTVTIPVRGFEDINISFKKECGSM